MLVGEHQDSYLALPTHSSAEMQDLPEFFSFFAALA
jgi:hypothetical protein